MSRVITDFYWEPGRGFDAIAGSTLSDPAKVRVDPRTFRAELKLNAAFRYPTDADLYVRPPIARPEAVRKLLIAQLEAELPEGTSVGFRLFDGAGEFYFDGGSWRAPNPGEWNTIEELNAALPTYDVKSTREFAPVLNLRTTDDRVTPSVACLSLLWEGTVDWYADALVDSLTATYQEALDFRLRLALPPVVTAPVASIDLDDYRDDAGLQIVDVEEVYDLSNDPNLLVDLLASYDPGTRVISLSAPIPVGGVPYPVLRVRPVVAWDTSEDFLEIGKVPQVALRDADSVSSSDYPAFAARGTVRSDTGEAVEILPPHRTTYRIEMELRTDRSREQAGLLEAATRAIVAGPPGEVGPFVRSRATDRRFRTILREQFSAVPIEGDVGDVRAFKTRFDLVDVAAQLRPERDTFGVLAVKTTWANVDSRRESDALASGAPVPASTPETH